MTTICRIPKRWLFAIGLTAILSVCCGMFLILEPSTEPVNRLNVQHFETISTLFYTVESKGNKVNCVPNKPYRYPERVDFRIIVLTFNRPQSLLRLLETLNTVELDGDSGGLEIWIDRDTNGSIHSKTLEVASGFRWKRGPTRVHVQKRHVGLYGQWIDTWSPHDHSKNSTEIAVILEDDLLVSPFIYRWLKAVHRHYGNQPEFFGATLVSDEPKGKESQRPHMHYHRDHTVYYHKYPDTWGLSPSPYHWNLFQQWFHRVQSTRTEFKPYVTGTVFTEWYKTFERRGTASNMWSMWAIYYANSEQLFTVYNNLMLYTNNNSSCLTINKREAGLHYYKGQSLSKPICNLLTEWKTEYITFPKEILRVDWKGKLLKNYFQ